MGSTGELWRFRSLKSCFVFSHILKVVMILLAELVLIAGDFGPIQCFHGL